MFNDFMIEYAALEAQKSVIQTEFININYDILADEAWCWFGGKAPMGQRSDQQQFTKIADKYLLDAIAMAISLLLPSNRPWHKLVTLDDNSAMQSKLDKINKLLFKYRYNPRTYFDGELNKVMTQYLKYGNGILFVDKLKVKQPDVYVPFYKNVHVSEFVCARDDYFNIVRAYRRVYMTPTAIKSKWPHANLGGTVLNDEQIHGAESPYIRSGEPLVGISYATDGKEISNNPDLIPILHVVVKADENYYKSYTYLKNTGQLLDEGAYTYMPYIMVRYNTSVNETWGRGPSYIALPLVKQLNDLRKSYMNYVTMATTPPIAVSDSALGQFIKAGHFIPNAIDHRTGQLKIQQIKIESDLKQYDYNFNYIADEIKNIFWASLFTNLDTNTSRDITATEINEHKIETAQKLSPAFSRFQSEFCNPLILTEVKILGDSGIIDLKEVNDNVDVSYSSPFDQSRNLNEASNLIQLVETLINLEKGFPTISQYFMSGKSSIGKIVQEIERLYGMDEDLVLSDKIIKATEDAITKQQQQQQQPQQPNTALPNAGMDPKTLMDLLKQQSGG